MSQVYRTLRVAPSHEGVIGVVIDAPPMNLIGPDLVRDLVSLLGALESDQEARVTAALFTQGLQTRGPLELHLGDRIGAL
jgi:enoyl-CoA hydratase/carnithine racemase